jgi:hypothetical protein
VGVEDVLYLGVFLLPLVFGSMIHDREMYLGYSWPIVTRGRIPLRVPLHSVLKDIEVFTNFRSQAFSPHMSYSYEVINCASRGRQHGNFSNT